MQLLIVKSTALPRKHGLCRLNTQDRITTEAPRTFTAILNNAAVISNRFYEDIGRDLFAQQPTVDYGFITHLSKNKLSKFKNDEGESVAIDKYKKIVIAGDLWAGAQGKFKGTERRLYLKFGFAYTLKVHEKIKQKIFAEFFWNGKTVERKLANIQSKNSEDQIYKKLLAIINEVTSTILKEKKLPKEKQCLDKLNKKLQKVLESRPRITS